MKRFHLAIIVFIMVFALLIVFKHFRRQTGPKNVTPEQFAETIAVKWNDWLQFTDDLRNPIFQGKLLKISNDGFGLAIGVLVEKHLPKKMIEDLQKDYSLIYLEKGKILGRFIIALQTEQSITELSDDHLKGKIEEYLNASSEINPIILLESSTDIGFANKANLDQWREIWNSRIKE